MTPTKTLILLVATALALVGQAVGDEQTLDLINRVCRTTSDPAFCSKILYINLPGPKADLAGLTQLTVSLTLSMATDTLRFIQKEMAAETNPNVRGMYSVCEGRYKLVEGFMKGADYDAKRGDFKPMVTLLKSSSKPIIICQDAIGRLVPAMLQKNRMIRVFLSAALYEGTIL